MPAADTDIPDALDFSFVVYVTSVQNYTAGGFCGLFKHYLLPWFENASNFAF